MFVESPKDYKTLHSCGVPSGVRSSLMRRDEWHSSTS
jgi:hypothetical protein